jgi:voltage-gated potassium channel
MSWALRAGEPVQGARGLLQVLALPMLLVNVLVVVGTVGYVLIEGWSVLDALWMVVITLATIGYGEIHPLSQEGRIFTLAFIVTGIGVAGRAVSDIARYVAAGGLAHDLRDRRHHRELLAMQDHYIVVGYGRLGREIVADLQHHGREVLVIDTKFPDPLPSNIRFLQGDATLDATLQEAGIQRARGLAIATPSDPVNVYITLSARQLSPQLHIATRIEDEAAADKARRAGATSVLLHYHTSGARMAQSMMRPGASTFMEHASTRHFDDLLIEDVLVGPDPRFHGTLRQLDLRNEHDITVVAIRKQGSEALETPQPNRPIEQGDTLVVVGHPSKVLAFEREVSGAQPVSRTER